MKLKKVEILMMDDSEYIKHLNEVVEKGEEIIVNCLKYSQRKDYNC